MRPLVSDRYIFYKSDQNPVYDEIPVHWPLAVLSGLVIGFLAITIVFWLRSSLSSWARVMYGIYLTMIGIVLGIPGLFLAVVSSFTDHSVTYYNENLIFVNPLTFIFIMVGVAIARNKNRGWIWLDRLWVIHIILLTITIALKVIPAFDQDNFLVIAFVVPIFILNMYAVKLIPKTKKVQYTY